MKTLLQLAVRFVLVLLVVAALVAFATLW